MAYELIWEPHGVVKHFVGHVTDGDLLGAVNEVCGDIRFDSLRYVLNDLSDVESQSVSKEAIDGYAAQRIGALMLNAKIVSPFIASSPGALSIVEAITSPQRGTEHPWMIFATADAARQWLASLAV